MSNLQNIFIVVIIFTISCCQSTYIKTDELAVTEPPPDVRPTEEPQAMTTAGNIQDVLNEIVKQDSEKVEEVKAIFAENNSMPEAPISPELNSDETRPIFTGNLFEIHLTIKHIWDDDFVDSRSKKFAELSKLIDTDLISFFDNQLNVEMSIRRGSFVLKNVLPSSTDHYLYVTFVAESSDNVTGQTMYEKLENWLLLYSNFYELEVLRDGFEFKAVTNEEMEKFDKHVECDSQFCKTTPEPSPKTSNSFLQDSQTAEELPELSELPFQSTSSDECIPNEKFNRGSTAIYIFDNNHKCVENVKKRSLLSSPESCSGNSQTIEKNTSNVSEGEDDLVVAASENYPQTSDKDRDTKDDEVIVVVRKRGDKVFIEI